MPTLNLAILVRNFISTGGSERYAYEVTKRLVRKGHKVTVFCWQAEAALVENINIIKVPGPYGFSGVTRLFSYIRQVSKLLDNHNFDVIHSHERGYIQDLLTVHCFSYASGLNQYCGLRKIDQLYLSPRSWLYLWIEKKQMQTPWLAAVSKVIQDDISSNYHRQNNVRVITPGVDTNFFNPDWCSQHRALRRQEEHIADNELAVLFVGSEFKRKGLDRLIPALGKNMKLIVLGKGEKHAHYRKLAEKHNVEDRVFFKGLCDDVRKYYALADVVVLPSLSEAFGMSILEAMSCGIPVIASPDSGVSALICQEENGFLATRTDDISNLLKRLGDPELRKQVGIQARKTAENYTWDSIADSYEKLYEEIVTAKAKRL
ncbi:MAG: glycosyltransferase family 4 protein [Proteobacteria bacterium]|nr:glycosyltransferase family 4 protein [Pseudomonadota bacterium]MBU1710201.1 glycosyltransferase family 4 protein [Pseudomonadota bacterium]